ncbi:hypothetical protein GW7_08818 [Heterocephalus glaber]|uniref:Uncharacterized protein n=1 Tax=Heterocephalus glaber TaxID=10181 RepID=G5CA93_HETGA|nr:hypothetical protein GW7_08818 [Heterocephalus glaber]
MTPPRLGWPKWFRVWACAPPAQGLRRRKCQTPKPPPPPRGTRLSTGSFRRVPACLHPGAAWARARPSEPEVSAAQEGSGARSAAGPQSAGLRTDTPRGQLRPDAPRARRPRREEEERCEVALGREVARGDARNSCSGGAACAPGGHTSLRSPLGNLPGLLPSHLTPPTLSLPATALPPGPCSHIVRCGCQLGVRRKRRKGNVRRWASGVPSFGGALLPHAADSELGIGSS